MSKGVHIRTLRWAKCSRGDRFERRAMRKTKRLKKVVGPNVEAKKTKWRWRALKAIVMTAMLDYLEGTTTPAMTKC
jgi:hypothetical protein